MRALISKKYDFNRKCIQSNTYMDQARAPNFMKLGFKENVGR